MPLSTAKADLAAAQLTELVQRAQADGITITLPTTATGGRK
jgi:hypothetical protein